MQILRGGFYAFLCVCVYVCSCLLASCDGQLPTLPRPWKLPRWLTQIDTARDERNAHTHSLWCTHTHTHTHSDEHLRGHPTHRDAHVVPSEQVKEESKSFYGFILGWPQTFLMQQSFIRMWIFLLKGYYTAVIWNYEFVQGLSRLATVCILQKVQNMCRAAQKWLPGPRQPQLITCMWATRFGKRLVGSDGLLLGSWVLYQIENLTLWSEHDKLTVIHTLPPVFTVGQ